MGAVNPSGGMRNECGPMEIEQPSPLGSLLLRTRKRADLTQEALAERATVSVNTISNLEAGRGHLPRQATLDLLVNALAAALSGARLEQTALRTAFKEAAEATRARLRALDAGPQATQPEPPAAPLLPSGTLTFMICTFVSDCPGPRTGIPRLATLLRRCVPPRRGWLVDPPDAPEGAVAVFTQIGDALRSACTLRQALVSDAPGTAVPVCLALHTGWAEPGAGDYLGPTRRTATRLARLGHGGQLLLSRPSRDLIWRTLPEGVRLQEAGRHSLCAVERPQPIYQVVPVGVPTDFPPLRPPPIPVTNLPVQVSSFIGREREQAAVSQLLAQAPLVTLVGAGGCGKTRLALQAAADLVEGYQDGVWLVELAALRDPVLVTQAMATALSLREEPGRTLQETVLDALKPRRLLLVLDNCEQVVAACAELAAVLLRHCPRLQLLATSRERLAIRGETAYRVPSLSLPDPDQHPTLTALSAYEGVRLFVEHARTGRPAFALTEENAGMVVHICRRLDGIPLAIELAAARVANLPLETIAARLDQSIGMLTGGPRDVLPRHQTLHAALDWSWTLLDEQEQALLRRLSVFAGGWRLGAAVAVCAGNGIADWAVPDLLERLINKSLVSLDERDAAAYHRLLEIVRQFAIERLAEGGELSAARDRHLDWCVALAEEAAGKLKGPEQGAWLERLQHEHDNLRAALDWSLRDQGDAALGLRLAGVLWRFWLTRGYPSEGRAWLEEALAKNEQDPNPMRARAVEGAGSLAYAQGDYPRAVALHEDALALNRVLEDPCGVAAALNNLGNVAFQQDEYERAKALHEESLALRRSLGDTWGIAASLGNLGHVADLQGDFRRAEALFGEALALQRSLGDTWGIATSLNNLGLVVKHQGEYARAAAQIEESLALFRALGNTYGIARALDSRGDVAYQQGDYERAAALHEESLPLRRALGDTQGVAASLNGMGQVAYQLGEYGRATALFEEALALHRRLGDISGIAGSLNHLGQVAERQGDYERAVALVAESLRLSREIGASDLVGEGLESMAWLAAAGNQQPRAARLGGAAEASREALGLPLSPGRRAGHDRATRSMRLALGEAAFAAAWTEGRALPREQAIGLARVDGKGDA